MLADAGLDMSDAAPSSVLVPLLELGGAANADDTEMHERWSALLANTMGDGGLPM